MLQLELHVLSSKNKCRRICVSIKKVFNGKGEKTGGLWLKPIAAYFRNPQRPATMGPNSATPNTLRYPGSYFSIMPPPIF